MPLSAREAALNALRACRRNNAWSDASLNAVINREKLDVRDAALASRLCYGVVQNTALCDYYIAYYSSVKISKIEPAVLDILRIGVYQLLFLDKIPPSAAVNEAVRLTKKYSPKAAGFVNAILRKVSAKNLPEIKTGDKFNDLSVKIEKSNSFKYSVSPVNTADRVVLS